MPEAEAIGTHAGSAQAVIVILSILASMCQCHLRNNLV